MSKELETGLDNQRFVVVLLSRLEMHDSKTYKRYPMLRNNADKPQPS